MYGEQALWYSTDESVTWYNISGGKFGSVRQNFKYAYLIYSLFFKEQFLGNIEKMPKIV